MSRGAIGALTIVLLAFIARVRGLGDQSFWWDEAYSAVVARGSLRQIVTELATNDFHPPFHYLLFHYWSNVAGEGEFALRYTAVVAGTATVALAFATGRRLFGLCGGLISAILFATSPFLIYYSTEARMFALAAMFAVLITYLGHRAIHSDSWRFWALLSLTFATSLYNFYYAVFGIIPVALYAILFSNSRPKALLTLAGAGFASAVLYAPWIPIMAGRIENWASPWTPPTTPQRVISWTWPTLFTGIPAIEQWDNPTLWLFFLVVPVIGLILTLMLWKAPAPYRRGLSLALMAGLVPLLLMVLVAIIRPIYHPRYAIPAAPGILLGLAGLISLPLRLIVILRIALAISVFSLFGFGIWRYHLGDGLTRDNYREAIGYITLNQHSGDTAINNVPPAFAYYYSGPMPNREFPNEPYDPVKIVADLNQIAIGYKRIWYVTHLLRPSDPEGFVQGQLMHYARPVESREFGPITVALFELPATPAFALPTRRVIPDIEVGDDLELIEMGMDDKASLSGSSVQVTLTWRVKRQPAQDLGVWVRLMDDQGFSWGREDHRPRNSAFMTTSGWPRDSIVISRHEIPLLSGTPPGAYKLETGVYRIDNLLGLEFRTRSGEKIGPALTWGEATVSSNSTPRVDPTLGGATGIIDQSIRLMGSGLGQKETAAGNTIDLTALWGVTGPVGPREFIARLIAPDGQLVREQRQPTLSGRYPEAFWHVGELLRDQTRLAIPAAAPAGVYRVQVGLSSPGQVGTLIEVGTLNIAAIPRSFVAPDIDHRREIAFGDGMNLIGWNLTRSAGTVRIVLYWQPTANPSKDYRVFNHLIANGGGILAQNDGVPASWTRPTTGWIEGEVVEDKYDIEVPANAAKLTLRIGVYDPINGKRLILQDGSDHADLMEIGP